MRTRQVAALSAAAAMSLLAIAGCSSSATGGAAAGSATSAASSAPAASNAGLTDQQLLTAFKAAAAQATAVHVKGAIKSDGQSISLDLQLNKKGDSASGTLSSDGATIPVVAVGGTMYIQMTESVLKMAGNVPSATAAILKDKWVSSKSSIGSSMGSQFAGFTSYDSFISSMTGDSGNLSGTKPAGTTTYNGQAVAVYKDSDGAIAYFAAGGPAYLLQVQNNASTSSGSLVFTWNQPTTVTAPPASQMFNMG